MKKLIPILIFCLFCLNCEQGWLKDILVPPVEGCMDSNSCNYNSEAEEDDGSCVAKQGCNNWCEGDSFEVALLDNCSTCDSDVSNDCEQDCAGTWGGTAFIDACGNCDGLITEDMLETMECPCDEGVDRDCAGVCGGDAVDSDGDGICDSDEVDAYGCLNSNACNYNPDATLSNDSCWYANEGCECVDGEGLVADECGVCDGDGTSCLDLCGVYNGDNSTCLDYCGVPIGNYSGCQNGNGSQCYDFQIQNNFNQEAYLSDLQILQDLVDINDGISSVESLYDGNQICWENGILKKLHLSYSDINNIPESIGNFAGLVTLSLSDNQITSIPVNIGLLSDLYNIQLSDNQLTSLPESICNIYPNLGTVEQDGFNGFSIFNNFICGELPFCLTADDIGSQYIVADCAGVCGGTSVDTDGNGICDSDEPVYGCTTPGACNFDASATIFDDSCWSATEGCVCSDGEGSVADECGTCDADSSNDCVQDECGVWGGNDDSCPNLNELIDIEIDDDNRASNTWCNQDEKADVSEVIEISVKVKNNGAGTAYNVTGSISLPNNDLSCANIDDSSVNFPDISSDSNIWSNGDFDIYIYCAPNGDDLDFTLELTYENSSGQSFTSEIDFDVDVGEEPIPIIDDATLTIFGHVSAGSPSLSDLELYKNSNAFNESNDCGDYGGSTWEETGYGTTGGTWKPIYFDAKEIVESWMIDGYDNNGFSVKPQYTGYDYEFQIGMSEGSSSRRPNLEIIYHFQGGSEKNIESNPEMDIRYWYCNSSSNGCENTTSIQIGRMNYNCSNETDEAKIYFELKEEDF